MDSSSQETTLDTSRAIIDEMALALSNPDHSRALLDDDDDDDDDDSSLSDELSSNKENAFGVGRLANILNRDRGADDDTSPLVEVRDKSFLSQRRIQPETHRHSLMHEAEADRCTEETEKFSNASAHKSRWMEHCTFDDGNKMEKKTGPEEYGAIHDEQKQLDDSDLTDWMNSKYGTTDVTNDETMLEDNSILLQLRPYEQAPIDSDDNNNKSNDQIFKETNFQWQSRRQPFIDDEMIQVVSFDRTEGKNERLFKEKYSTFVSDTISTFDQANPGRLRAFKSMSHAQKTEELRKVKALLAKLGASNLQIVAESHHFSHSSKPSGNAISLSLSLSKTDVMKVRPSSQYREATPNQDNTFECNDLGSTTLDRTHEDSTSLHDTSFALLSPTEIDEKRMWPSGKLRDSDATSLGSLQKSASAVSLRLPDFPRPDDDASTSSSVELVRRSAREASFSPRAYESPDSASRPCSHKRLATTSGKRGMDLSRLRIDDSFENGSFANESHPSEAIPSPSQLDCSDIPSPDNAPLFRASQSPINIRSTMSSGESNAGEGDDSDSDSDGEVRMDLDDTVQTVDVTMIQAHKRRVRWREDGASYLQEVPANINLKDGATLHFQALNVARPEKGRRRNGRQLTSHLSFSDPLEPFRGRLGQKMNAVFDEILKRDEQGRESLIVFSMTTEQICSVAVKLLLEATDSKSHLSPGGHMVIGGTLIVARSKECLDEWEKAMRVGTFHSVLNHSTMPLSERTRATATKICSNYDVVLTTFDSIISKDTVVTLDTQGHAVSGKTGDKDGWYSAPRDNNQAPEERNRNTHLSVLHLIHWQRVLFVDSLGRKSYLAKVGTLRGKAAVALNSTRRYVFFAANAEEQITPILALRKSDRNAVRSVCAVLRLPLDKAEQCVVDDCCIDLRTFL